MAPKRPNISSANIEPECINHKGLDISKRKRNRGQIVGENEMKPSARNKEIVDRFSELPDNVLLHIMDFMDTKDAVQTCVLSKRWKDLCKFLTNLTFDRHRRRRGRINIFEKFVSWVLTSRDDSCSLQNFVIEDWVDLAVLDKLSKYAVCHGVKQLKMNIISTGAPFESLPLICNCHTLTSLKLCSTADSYLGKLLPKSLHMPSLKSLHLQCFTFSARDNVCVEPFSNCHLLNILVLKHCCLPNDVRVLDICNSSLSSLTIGELGPAHLCEIVLSTPNLISCTIMGLACDCFSSKCNLSFLEEVNIFDGCDLRKSSMVIRWLQVLANVKILTLTCKVLQLIESDLSNQNLMRPIPPRFTRLESLRVKKTLPITVSDEEVTRGVNHLLQNSPMAKVDIIPWHSLFL